MDKNGYLIGFKELDGVFIHKVKNDKNGNPRYLVHKMFFDLNYQKACKIAATVGFSQCRKKEYGQYLICTTNKGYEGVLELIDLAISK